MQRILVTGANGQVGFELSGALAPLGQVLAATRADVDLTDEAQLLRFLDVTRPDIIVNPAAYTAVDKAEVEPDLAFSVNATAPAILASWAARHDTLLVHYSTDYIFDGECHRPYVEDDEPNPQSVYGKSKWHGEEAIRETSARHLIIRTSWVAGAHGNNFLKTILRLAKERDHLQVVADQFGAPTSARLIAEVTASLIERSRQSNPLPHGTYHVTASGETTWLEYARYIIGAAQRDGAKQALRPENITPITALEYGAPARRPLNSRLDCKKINGLGISLPNWQDGISHLLSELRVVPTAVSSTEAQKISD